MFAGGDIGEIDDQGLPVVGAPLVYVLNAGEEPVSFTLPTAAGVEAWACLIDTADDTHEGCRFAPGDRYPLAGRASAVLTIAPPGNGDAQ
jgi:hypothetical protein